MTAFRSAAASTTPVETLTGAPLAAGVVDGTAGPTVHATRTELPGRIRPCGRTDKTAPSTGPAPARPTN